MIQLVSRGLRNAPVKNTRKQVDRDRGDEEEGAPSGGSAA